MSGDEMINWDELASELQRTGGGFDQPCPHCSGTLTFRVSTPSVDVLHTQPPCDEFRGFCERLITRRYGGSS